MKPKTVSLTLLCGRHLQGSLKVLKYHGLNREEDLRKIEDSDIVLTTYNTLAAEFSDKRSRLHKIGWWRVVLDEGEQPNNREQQSGRPVF